MLLDFNYFTTSKKISYQAYDIIGNTNIKEKKIIAELQIPKLNIYVPLYAINSIENNIDINVEIILGSSMPDVDNSHLVIIGHSGYGPLAYFKELDRVTLLDSAYISYNNVLYQYNVQKIYTQDKAKSNRISYNSNIKSLTLITCHPKIKGKYIFLYLEIVKTSPLTKD